LNWNSIVRSSSALVVYCSLVWLYILGVQPLVFALVAALVLSVGILLHSIDFNALKSEPNSKISLPTKERSFIDSQNVVASALPTVSESMEQLHSLQNEISYLQAQFAIEADQISTRLNADEAALQNRGQPWEPLP